MTYNRVMLFINIVALVAALAILYGIARLGCWAIG